MTTQPMRRYVVGDLGRAIKCRLYKADSFSTAAALYIADEFGDELVHRFTCAYGPVFRGWALTNGQRIGAIELADDSEVYQHKSGAWLVHPWPDPAYRDKPTDHQALIDEGLYTLRNDYR